jgi:hypothetical protein
MTHEEKDDVKEKRTKYQGRTWRHEEKANT